MELLTLIIVFIVGLFLGIEVVKHHILKKWRELFVLLIIVFIILFVVNNYFDVGSLFKKDNPVSATGHAVFTAAKENFKDIDVKGSLLKGAESKTKKYIKENIKEIIE